jgi:hypothetical protein
VGIVLFLIGLGVTAGALRWYANPERQLKKQLRAAAATDIARVAEGETTRMIGWARVYKDKLEAPLTGRACVYYILTVDREGGEDGWKQILREETGVPFVLDDGTGHALVDPGRCELALEFDRQERTGTWQTPDERQAAILDRIGVDAGHTYRYREAAIETDEKVAVLGSGKRELDPSAAPTGYRDQAGTLLRIEGGAIISDDPSTKY